MWSIYGAGTLKEVTHMRRFHETLERLACHKGWMRNEIDEACSGCRKEHRPWDGVLIEEE